MLSLSQEIELLHASTDRLNLVDVPVRRLLAVDGVGDPTGPAFLEACEALVAAADAVAAMRRRRAGALVPHGHLEAIWWKEQTTSWLEAISLPDPWHWELLIECPSGDADDNVHTTLERAAGYPGALAEVAQVRLIRLTEGPSVQTLHFGRFESKVNLLQWLFRELAAMGLRVTGRQHEIYMTDPRRTVPGAWRTIVRYPVSPTLPEPA
jgi:hypothetical protein